MLIELPVKGFPQSIALGVKDLSQRRVQPLPSINDGTSDVPSSFNADFIAIPPQGTAALFVQFTGLSANPVESWHWLFGDDMSTSNVQNPTHVFTQPGQYTVSLTATGLGGVNSVTKIHYITVYPPVVAEFSAIPLTGTAPLTVDFTDLTQGNPTGWTWDFGDV